MEATFFSHGTETHHLKPQLRMCGLHFFARGGWVRLHDSDNSIFAIRAVLSWLVGFLSLLVAMAPHLTKLELDFIFEEEGKGVPMKEIHKMLQRRRAKQGHDAPCFRRFSEALRGITYRRSKKET